MRREGQASTVPPTVLPTVPPSAPRGSAKHAQYRPHFHRQFRPQFRPQFHPQFRPQLRPSAPSSAHSSAHKQFCQAFSDSPPVPPSAPSFAQFRLASPVPPSFTQHRKKFGGQFEPRAEPRSFSSCCGGRAPRTMAQRAQNDGSGAHGGRNDVSRTRLRCCLPWCCRVLLLRCGAQLWR